MYISQRVEAEINYFIFPSVLGISIARQTSVANYMLTWNIPNTPNPACRSMDIVRSQLLARSSLYLELLFLCCILVRSFDERIFPVSKKGRKSAYCCQSLLTAQEVVDQPGLFCLAFLGDDDATGVTSDAVDSFEAPNLGKGQ